MQDPAALTPGYDSLHRYRGAISNPPRRTRDDKVEKSSRHANIFEVSNTEKWRNKKNNLDFPLCASVSSVVKGFEFFLTVPMRYSCHLF
jgi:hypothetical protein